MKIECVMECRRCGATVIGGGGPCCDYCAVRSLVVTHGAGLPVLAFVETAEADLERVATLAGVESADAIQGRVEPLAVFPTRPFPQSEVSRALALARGKIKGRVSILFGPDVGALVPWWPSSGLDPFRYMVVEDRTDEPVASIVLTLPRLRSPHWRGEKALRGTGVLRAVLGIGAPRRCVVARCALPCLADSLVCGKHRGGRFPR